MERLLQIYAFARRKSKNVHQSCKDKMVSSRKTTAAPSAQKKGRKRGGAAPITEREQKALFQELVVPHLTSIKSLTVRYTDRYQDVEDNFNYVLAQMYSYIYTYDPKKSLDTWLHIVTKRACFNQNDKRAQYLSMVTDLEYCTPDVLHQHGTANMIDASFGTLADNLSDVMYEALMQIDPCKLSPFLLYAQGMGVREITQLEWKAGHLERKSEDMVKSRIYWAKKQLQYILKQYGISEASYTSAFRNQ